MSTLELYNDAIKPLPPEERLRIAALILNDATAPPVPAADPWTEEGVDVSDEWTDEDMEDLRKHSMARLAEQLEGEAGYDDA